MGVGPEDVGPAGPTSLYVQDRICRACWEDDETLDHSLYQCPAFANIRIQFLENDYIPDLNQIMLNGIKQIWDFVKATEFLILQKFCCLLSIIS